MLPLRSESRRPSMDGREAEFTWGFPKIMGVSWALEVIQGFIRFRGVGGL